MIAKKLLLLFLIALVVMASNPGHAVVVSQAEQNWIKSQNPKSQIIPAGAYYVRYKKNLTKSSNRRSFKAHLKSSLKSHGGEITHEFDQVNTVAIRINKNEAFKIKTMSDVEFIEPVPKHKLLAQVIPWNVDQFQAREVWDKNRDGEIDVGAADGTGVKICIIDSGFYAAHDDFQGIKHTGTSQILGEAYTEDGNGHGTHVAGIANAVNNDFGTVGVLPGKAEFHIVKIFNNQGEWVDGQSNLGAAALDCQANNANVISMSLGGDFSVAENDIFQSLYDQTTLGSAPYNKEGILLVSAAGNSGNDDRSYPASYDSVISVAALQENEQVARFSQYPTSSRDPISPPENAEWDVVEFSGGGQQIFSTWSELIAITNDDIEYESFHIQGSAKSIQTATLVDGGFCDDADRDSSWADKVVLCERGNNTFAEKINNVEAEKGLSVIVFNNDLNADAPLYSTCIDYAAEPEPINECTGGIAAVTLTRADGEHLRDHRVGTTTEVYAGPGTNYFANSGTSMATPGVAAGLALTWSACGGSTSLSNKEIRQLLRDSAKDLSGEHNSGGTYGMGYDNMTGFGLVQLKDALELGNQRFGSKCPLGLTVSQKELSVCTMSPPSEPVFNLKLDSSFNATSNMSSSGLPSGVLGQYSINPVVNPTKETDFIISNLDGVENGRHTITLTATDSDTLSNTAGADVVLNTYSSRPIELILNDPANGEEFVELKPTMSWSEALQADSYNLEIATDRFFSNIVINQMGLTKNSYTLTSTLLPNTDYFWRVKAVNPCGETVSEISSFTTVANYCFAPALAIPDNSEIGISDTRNLGFLGKVTDLNVELKIDHSWVGDLTVTLVDDSSGVSVDLLNRAGTESDSVGCGGNDVKAVFDDAATFNAEEQCNNQPAIHDFVVPYQALSAFNEQEFSGDWTLLVSDESDGDTGTLQEWCLIAQVEIPTNIKPVLNPIGNKTIQELKELTFLATATDSDNPTQNLTYSLINAPAGALISTEGQFSWTPTESQGVTGSYTFDVIVTDDGVGNLTDSETITVTVDKVNSAPALDKVGNHTVQELGELLFTAVAVDSDEPKQNLSYSLINAPVGASISTDGQFRWKPTEAQGSTGSFTFDVMVNDDGEGNLSDSETITVTVIKENSAPTLNPIGNKTIAEHTELAFIATATDSDEPAQNLKFSLINAPVGATITTEGEFSWTPTESQGTTGSFTFDIMVSDGGIDALTDSETITVVVTKVNVAPILEPIGNQKVEQLNELTFTAIASDADEPAQSLVFSLVGAPMGASITDDGVFSWTPNEDQGTEGSFTFDVMVSDGDFNSLSDSETITVIVTKPIVLCNPKDMIFSTSFEVNQNSCEQLTISSAD